MLWAAPPSALPAPWWTASPSQVNKIKGAQLLCSFFVCSGDSRIARLRAAGCRPYEVGGGAEGKERRQNRNRIRSVRYRKLSVYCPHSSSVKNQRFLPPSPGGKALAGGGSPPPQFCARLSRQRTAPVLPCLNIYTLLDRY